MSLASVVSGKWSTVQLAGGNAGASANDVHGVLSAFLKDRTGQAVSVQESDKTLYVQASNGDTLILLPDGSGVSTAVRGMVLEQKEYAKGGLLTQTVHVQRDDSGNVLVQTQGVGYEFSGSEDATGRMTHGVYKTFTPQGVLTGSTVSTLQGDGTLLIQSYDGQGYMLNHVQKQVFDDGTAIEVKTENGQQYVRGTDADNHSSDWKSLATGQTQTQTYYDNQLYSDMAGFLNALRAKDKVGQVLYGAKMVLDQQFASGAKVADLAAINQAVQGLSATVGIVAGLHALQSSDVQTQLSGAVGLLYSTNSLAGIVGVTHQTAAGETAKGFLSGAQLGALATVGAVLSIANLRNLDTMLDNGQVGSATARQRVGWVCHRVSRLRKRTRSGCSSALPLTRD